MGSNGGAGGRVFRSIGDGRGGLARFHAGIVVLLALLLAAVLTAAPASAMKPIPIPAEPERLEITTLGEYFDGRGDTLQVETATAMDGSSGRMMVRATTPGTNPNWIVFGLTNTTDKPMERWLTADRYNVIGSGAIWPDLDARRIEAVTPSLGFVPERIKSDRADIFRITLEPGQTITYVAELSSERFARLYLWKPLDYEIKVRDRQLFNGIMLGLVGLLAIFLTAIFAANHKLIFPAAALVCWCVLGYLCVDFGFFHKLFVLRPEDNAVYRAAAEAAVGSSLVIFLHTFLRLGLWHGLIRMLIGVWMVAQLSLIAVAVIDPRLASTFARMSFLCIGAVGALFTLFLAVRGQDRALSLIPTWLLFLVWIFAASVVLTGRMSGDIVVSGLVSGLVLIVVLIGFTVTQFAFRSLEPMYGNTQTETQVRALAVDSAGAAVWEWNARRDEIKVSPFVELTLGLNAGELSSKLEDFAKHLHPADRERFRLMLWSIQERAGGKIRTDFRLRHADNSYRAFELEAASVPTGDRNVRCVGLMRDVTDVKRAHERLLHDAVHDSLTGLPNRELFLDRLGIAMNRAKTEATVRPTVLFIDVDKFKSVNTSFGLVVGDSLLLTLARRLQRHLGEMDTLARVGGDQFAILFINEQVPQELAALAERIRRSLRSPIKISGQDIVLTASIGIAVYDGQQQELHDVLKEAETAMYRAKRGGADRIELFTPEMRGEKDDRVAIESDLRKALEKSQLKIVYQPIIYLPTEELAGFEALVRWEHPKLGMLNPARFVPVAEESDLIVKLGSYVLLGAAKEAARWQKEMPRPDNPLFVSVNVSSRQLFRQDLIQEIRHILGRQLVPQGSLKLEITESLVMENPEQATEILEQLRGAGAELSLDDFGTGYSSLAYLQRFPFDAIKIDRALVQAAGAGDAGGAAIVRSMVALAHELGKKVVAEGVETPEDVGFVRAIGCEYGQGFYYGEAMADRDVIALLKLVQKTERKLQPRGFFRLNRTNKKKGKPERRKPEAATEGGVPSDVVAAAGAETPDAGARKAGAKSVLPGAKLKTRVKPAKTAEVVADAGTNSPTAQPAAAPSTVPASATGAAAQNGSYPIPAAGAPGSGAGVGMPPPPSMPKPGTLPSMPTASSHQPPPPMAVAAPVAYPPPPAPSLPIGYPMAGGANAAGPAGVPPAAQIPAPVQPFAPVPPPSPVAAATPVMPVAPVAPVAPQPPVPPSASWPAPPPAPVPAQRADDPQLDAQPAWLSPASPAPAEAAPLPLPWQIEPEHVAEPGYPASSATPPEVVAAPTGLPDAAAPNMMPAQPPAQAAPVPAASAVPAGDVPPSRGRPAQPGRSGATLPPKVAASLAKLAGKPVKSSVGE